MVTWLKNVLKDPASEGNRVDKDTAISSIEGDKGISRL
jgi:hypothetical protein